MNKRKRHTDEEIVLNDDEEFVVDNNKMTSWRGKIERKRESKKMIVEETI